jgi:hypothetical protein
MFERARTNTVYGRIVVSIVCLLAATKEPAAASPASPSRNRSKCSCASGGLSRTPVRSSTKGIEALTSGGGP